MQVIGPLLNEAQSHAMEDIQVKSLQIVLGARSMSYARNLAALGLESLATRRAILVKTFAIQCFKSTEHRWWFKPHPPLPLNTRLKPPRFEVPLSKKDRDLKRPIVA